jgi:hypothetical protein
LEDGITTLAYGPYQVTAEEVDIGIPENEQRLCQSMRPEKAKNKQAKENRLLQSMPARLQICDDNDETEDETELISNCIGEWDIA